LNGRRRIPPEQEWRALTQDPLIEEWLLPNDFQPVIGYGSIAALERLTANFS
jgi:hypothetical protein